MSKHAITRSSILRLGAIGLSAILGGGLLAACGSDSGGKITNLKIGISPISIYAAGYEMTGCLQKKGYTVALPEFSATPDRLAALVNGSVDMAFGGFTDTIKLNSRGGSLVMVSNAGAGGYQLVASTKSGVSSIADLKGKKIAVPTGTIQELTLRYAMSRAGLDPAKDAQLLQMNYADMPVALKRGDIDAFVGTAPYPAISIAKGEKEIPWPANLPWGKLNSGLVTTSKLLKEHPDVAKAAVACLRQSTDKLNSDPSALKKLYISKYKVPHNAAGILMKQLTLTTKVDPKQVQGLINTEDSLGYIKKKPQLDDVYKAVS